MSTALSVDKKCHGCFCLAALAAALPAGGPIWMWRTRGRRGPWTVLAPQAQRKVRAGEFDEVAYLRFAPRVFSLTLL